MLGTWYCELIEDGSFIWQWSGTYAEMVHIAIERPETYKVLGVAAFYLLPSDIFVIKHESQY